jgi:hypothetical protein
MNEMTSYIQKRTKQLEKEYRDEKNIRAKDNK